MRWGTTPAERQRWLRIRLSVAAWTYEMHSVSIMSDAEFDRLCLEVDPGVSTGNRKLDRFFREVFSPHTGQWVHRHPEKEKLERIAQKYHLKGVDK